MKQMKKKSDVKGSLIIVSLIYTTLLLHAALEASPMYSRVVERSLQQESDYRLERINEAISRYRSKTAEHPVKLEDLVEGRYIPRIYDCPQRSRSWRIQRNAKGRIVGIE